MPQLNIWDLMMVVGIAQGMVMAFVLWLRKGLPISARFLAVIFFTLSFASFGTLLSEYEPVSITATYRWLMRYVPFYPFMAVGPSLLFMIYSHVDKGFVFNRIKRKHYWAVLFNIVPCAAWMSAWVFYKLDWDIYNKSKFLYFIYGFYTYGDIVYWLHLLVYTLIAKKYVRKHQPKSSRKLMQIIVAFQLFLIAWFPFLVLYVSPFNDVLEPWSYYPIFIPVTILIYWLGFQWFFYLNRKKAIGIKKGVETDKVRVLLESAIKSEFYLDTELSLKKLANELEIPQRSLSIYLNSELNCTFNEYINKHRIDAVKRKLDDPKFSHYTIAAIAYDSGFKSIATFQRSFKNLEGIDPSEYKKKP